MALGGGLVVPFTLRFYWWRFNGGGFAIGTFVGLTGAVLLRFAQIYGGDSNPMMTQMLNNPASQFFIAMGIGLAGTVVGTYLTRPTPQETIEQFYRVTRPFGVWGPLTHLLSPETRELTKREHRRDIKALPFALGWQITLFLLPMQLLIKSYYAFAVTAGIFAVSLGGLYWIWLRHLGDDKEQKRLNAAAK
jgi:hypothetical protein